MLIKTIKAIEETNSVPFATEMKTSSWKILKTLLQLSIERKRLPNDMTFWDV